jgi:hypothetical protein
LIVLTYATHNNLTFELHGAPAAASMPADLSDDLKLVEVPLPSQEEWERAKHRAAAIFGIVVPALRSARNLTRYGEQIGGKAEVALDPMRKLKAGVEGTVNPSLGITGETDRVRTIEEAAGLVEALVAAGDAEAIPVLAGHALAPTPESVARTLAEATTVGDAVSGASWPLIKAARDRAESNDEEAKAILDQLVKAAQASEIVTPLAPALAAAADAITGILAQEPIRNDTKPPTMGEGERHEDLSVAKARGILDELPDVDDVRVDLVVRRGVTNPP